MRLIQSLQRKRLMAIALAVACVMVAGVAVWYTSKLPAKASSKDTRHLQERLHNGVGSEVRFASAAANPEQIAEAVGSTADFIQWRSGLRMSDGMKRKLVEAESNVLQGRVRYLTIEELTDNLTAAVVDRLATLTDEEIRQAAEVSSNEDGQVLSRANGKWGVLTQKELIQQAKSGREWSRRGDSALQIGLRPMIEEEVNDRVSTLGAALPEQFGQARAQGVTPMQALLIAYSVAADDPLTDSRSDITQMLIQKRMDAGQTRAQKRAQQNVSGRPYGPHGLLHPSHPYLFFNRAGVYTLLNLTEGGKN
ncbi:MAG: hypothetical protein H7Y30_07055 [Pyrinomonadaceae bacterium]|nr:hypothetical protein [Pyrinomonadaceae bacterium]